MEQRILEGYEFVSKNFAPDDNVYIFGFSRGAHQARSLAGMISYAGVPVEQNDVNVQRKFTYNDVIELVKTKSDEDYREAWLSWSPGQAPPMESEINKKLGIGVKPVSIVFLGVWDTVPGSSLKKYGFCKEKRGFIKRGSVFIPGIDKGERYKTDSYPPIRHIAHAVSLDEKRSKFRPLLVCPAIKDAETEIHEVWFPGAHADVGGGYADSDELSRISLLWMAKLLAKHYPIELSLGNEGNALGLAHWSIGDRPANIGSTCEDRLPYSGARIHPSAEERKKASTVRIRLCDEEMGLPYPMTCEQALKVSQQAVSTSGTCSETACCNK